MNSMDEVLRLKELKKYNISYDVPDPCFTELAQIAKTVLDMPISGISLVDENHVWLKARVGVDFTCLNREGAFCAYAISNNTENYIVEDTLEDERYRDNALVLNNGIRFYASSILRNKQGFSIGTLWVMDIKPRKISAKDTTLLNSLASQSIRVMDSRYLNSVSGLPNRQTFVEQLQSVLNAYQRTEESRSHVIIGAIYIRNLDALDSMAGQSELGSVQSEIAVRLERLKIENYHIGHLNNDLFAFSIEKKKQACFSNSIGKIEAELAKPIVINNYKTSAMIAIGLVESPFNGVNASSLISQAIDVAKDMRNSKKEIVINKCALISHAEYVNSLYQDLNAPQCTPSLRPYYQPQVNLKSKTIIGFEALARWNNTNIGDVSPDDFIPIAESSGLIAGLDLYILKKVFEDLSKWQQNNVELVKVAVNLSRLTIISKNLIEKIEGIFESNMSLCKLCKIEITESIMLEEQDQTQRRIEQLKLLGFKISIDDFGTGFSNLSMLRSLQFDQLKVDRQFVHGIAGSEHISDLFSLIKNIASLFNAELICEGMENEEDIEVLLAHDAYIMQGWYFSKAISADLVPAILAINQQEKSGKVRNYKDLADQIHKAVSDKSLKH